MFLLLARLCAICVLVFVFRRWQVLSPRVFLHKMGLLTWLVFLFCHLSQDHGGRVYCFWWFTSTSPLMKLHRIWFVGLSSSWKEKRRHANQKTNRNICMASKTQAWPLAKSKQTKVSGAPKQLKNFFPISANMPTCIDLANLCQIISYHHICWHSGSPTHSQGILRLRRPRSLSNMLRITLQCLHYVYIMKPIKGDPQSRPHWQWPSLANHAY